jgi:GT2 family glycosyltransferase
MPDPTLAVSIVNYRTPDLLMRCLAALEVERADWGEALAVTVTDNASDDGSVEMVEQRFPWVRVIRNTANVGFGRAHNQALAGSTATWLLVLNSDATVAPGSLRTLADYLAGNPDVAVVGPRLRYPNGQVQPSRRRFPTFATFFLESTQLQRYSPDNAVLRRYYVADRSDDEVQDVDWLVGACLLVRAEAAAQVGLFDERFFLYSEEVDWCRRFRAAGWRVAYLPTAEVTHVEGASSERRLGVRDKEFQTSKLRYVRKWHGPRAATAVRAFLAAQYTLQLAEEGGKLALGSRVAERRARLSVLSGSLRHLLAGVGD